MTSPRPSVDLRSRYWDLLAYRREALDKVGARWTQQHCKLPARLYWPALFRRTARLEMPGIDMAMCRITGPAPAFVTARRALAEFSAPRVLDVGCGSGTFYHYLRSCEPKYQDALRYVGIDPAPPERLRFPVFRSLDEVPPEQFDLIMMSEVAEHMRAQSLVDEYLARFGPYMGAQSCLVLGIPNPLAPTVQHRDATHIQHYPWYDMYAILRFFFDEVAAQRTFFMQSMSRLVLLPIRYVVAHALEADWCDGLVFAARKPKLTSGGA